MQNGTDTEKTDKIGWGCFSSHQMQVHDCLTHYCWWKIGEHIYFSFWKNILFLVETDTNSINEQKDYKIKGYKTWFHLKKEPIHKTRMISLINENKENLKIRTDLMDTEIPSIWVEELNENSKIIIMIILTKFNHSC